MEITNNHFDEKEEIKKQILCHLNFMEKEEIINLFWNLQSMKNMKKQNENISKLQDTKSKLRGRKRRRQFDDDFQKTKKLEE